MKLTERINQDLKTALKAKDKVRVTTLRSIRALILEHEKSGRDVQVTEEDEIRILTSAAKKRKESIEQYRQAGREDLAEAEEKELKIIEEYLPEQLSERELLEEIKKLADEVGAEGKKDFSKLMPQAVKKFKGRADGKTIKNAVEKVLG
jgi:uncharacterized protein YqeY